jgi:predicted amidophosphoribosyltransferase
MTCSNCEKEFFEGSNFCSNCGNKLNENVSIFQGIHPEKQSTIDTGYMLISILFFFTTAIWFLCTVTSLRKEFSRPGFIKLFDTITIFTMIAEFIVMVIYSKRRFIRVTVLVCSSIGIAMLCLLAF